eukprot:5563427-Prymnesium_polylepis.1
MACALGSRMARSTAADRIACRAATQCRAGDSKAAGAFQQVRIAEAAKASVGVHVLYVCNVTSTAEVTNSVFH